MGELLRVDLDELSDAAQGLDGLRREFDDASRIVDAAKGSVGHPAVLDGLDEFSDNWKRHRKALSRSLEAVAGMARDSHQAYVDVDQTLAAGLRDGGRE
jgi:hypothetical protein